MCGDTLVPSYKAALGALGLIAAACAAVALLLLVVWAFTGYPLALRWVKVLTGLGAFAVGTIFISLGWTFTP